MKRKTQATRNDENLWIFDANGNDMVFFISYIIFPINGLSYLLQKENTCIMINNISITRKGKIILSK